MGYGLSHSLMRVDLQLAIHMLQQGQVVAIPTETVYGLAADARNDNALRQIYAIKERPANNPLIVHLANIGQVTDWASDFPPLAQRLAHVFWPGPFTLVLPAREEVSAIVRAGEPTVALRVPSHPLTHQLLAQSGLGLAAPSANKYTHLSPSCAAHVEGSLGEAIAVLDGGACQVGIESTIVSVAGDDWQLLRHGMITEQAVMNVAGKPALTVATYTPKAPGQHLLHYSPRTPSQLLQDVASIKTFVASHTNCVALLIEPFEVGCPALTIGNEPAHAAELLYAQLHQLDAMCAQHLLIQAVPDTDAWAGIRDRLQRATYGLSA